MEKTINREERISDKKDTALKLLEEKDISLYEVTQVWKLADDEYFVRESVANIVWHTEGIINFKSTGPLILVKDTDAVSSGEGATQVFIYTLNADYLFAICTAAFEKLNLDIQEARIFTSSHNHCMDTFTILEAEGFPIGENVQRKSEIIELLRGSLTGGYKNLKAPKIRRTRKEKYFCLLYTSPSPRDRG